MYQPNWSILKSIMMIRRKCWLVVYIYKIAKGEGAIHQRINIIM